LDCTTALTILDVTIGAIGLLFVILAAFEYTRLNKLRRDFRAFEKRLKREQHRNQKALQRVISSYSVKNPDQRIELLLTAVNTDPSVFNGYNALGYAYLEKGDTDAAIDAFKEAIAQHTEAKEGYIDLANAYYKIKRIDLCKKYLERAIKVDQSALDDIKNNPKLKSCLP
jgi:tetratricopeptide (TPR) repeat protein